MSAIKLRPYQRDDLARILAANRDQLRTVATRIATATPGCPLVNSPWQRTCQLIDNRTVLCG